jgi:hypothetical protein
MNSKAKGELSEAIILAHLIRKGYAVSLPFGNNQRYDLIYEDGARLVRAQCKTGRLVNGRILFAPFSINGFTGKKSNYHGSVDVFLVYCPHTETVYQVPIDETGSERNSYIALRVAPSRNNQSQGVRWAKDFVF